MPKPNFATHNSFEDVPKWCAMDPVELVHQGKVRDMYALTGYIIKTSNRLSVFDRVIKENVPLKGAMLNCISQCNKEKLLQLGYPTDYIPVPKSFFVAAGFKPEELGSLAYAEVLDMLPFEFIVRGYLVGSAYEAYKKGEPICGIVLPEGLNKGDKLPHPIVTPTTKEKTGHDKPVTKQECIEMLADWLLDEEIYLETETSFTDEAFYFGKEASDDGEEQYEYTLAYHCASIYIDTVYKYSLKIFDYLSKKCEEQGILFVDTKFEFGLDVNGTVTIADEVGTPDSSRFAFLDEYCATGKIVSLDKQNVRDYCASVGFTGEENQPIPEIPEEIWQKVSETYLYVAEKLCGKDKVAEYR